MRKAIGLFAVLWMFEVMAPAHTSAHQSHTTATTAGAAVLADGTPVKLRVGASINLATVRVGDDLELDVDEEIRMNDVAVIPTSSFAKVVVMAQPLDAAKAGKANISFRYVLLADGEKVALRPTREKKAAADRTVVSATESDVVIANGAEVTAYINGNLPLDLPKLRLANQPTNELKVTTTPAHAEVSVDGKILGSTPFSGRVVRGDHVLALRMAGFQPWRGTVRVTEEPASLQIALKKQDGLETVPPPVSQPPSLGDLARAARAKKAADGAPKAQGEPLELIPEEPKPSLDSLGTPQTPPLHPEPPNPPTAKNNPADPAAAGSGAATGEPPASSPAGTETAPGTPQAAPPSSSPSAPAAAQPNTSAQPGAASQPSSSAAPNSSVPANGTAPNSSSPTNSTQTNSTPPANGPSQTSSGQSSSSAPPNQ